MPVRNDRAQLNQTPGAIDYRLAPPPRGYRWVRPQDDRYLLVEIATGVISQALGY